MSNSSWKKQLSAIPAWKKSPKGAERILLAGLGNELNADDGAGMALIRWLRDQDNLREMGKRLRLVAAGTALENFTGEIRRFAPDLLVLIDAAEMAAPAGEIQVLDWRETRGFGPSTHLHALALTCSYLNSEVGCDIVLVGIQPHSLEMDQPLSQAVSMAVVELGSHFLQLLDA